MTRPQLRRPEVFAVEDTSMQVVWSDAPADAVVAVRAGPVTTTTAGTGGPGAVDLVGLQEGHPHVVEIRVDGDQWQRVDTITTLTPPPGEELSRLATVNDLHIGQARFGSVRPGPEDLDHAPRAARAALAAAQAWGATTLVAKGDLSDHGEVDQLAEAMDLLASSTLDVVVLPGNHDAEPGLATMRAVAAEKGITMADPVAREELAGLTVVAVDTTVEGHHHGRVGVLADAVLDAVSDKPAMIALHHNLQRFRLPNIWPPGISGPDASAFLDLVASVHPVSLITTGHTHRHRLHRHGPLPVSEIGSTCDFPGTWAGYVVHEGGVRQVVRRIAEPACMAWSERCRGVLGGVWGRWAPGPRAHRCFTHRWRH